MWTTLDIKAIIQPIPLGPLSGPNTGFDVSLADHVPVQLGHDGHFLADLVRTGDCGD